MPFRESRDGCVSLPAFLGLQSFLVTTPTSVITTAVVRSPSTSRLEGIPATHPPAPSILNHVGKASSATEVVCGHLGSWLCSPSVMVLKIAVATALVTGEGSPAEPRDGVLRRREHGDSALPPTVTNLWPPKAGLFSLPSIPTVPDV